MDRELQDKYDRLIRHHNATVGAVKTLNAGLAHLNTENDILKNQLVNANKFVEIQKKVVIDNLQQSAEVQHGLVKEIMVLKDKIKHLKRS